MVNLPEKAARTNDNCKYQVQLSGMLVHSDLICMLKHVSHVRLITFVQYREAYFLARGGTVTWQ